jgi:hypothetical protein
MILAPTNCFPSHIAETSMNTAVPRRRGLPATRRPDERRARVTACVWVAPPFQFPSASGDTRAYLASDRTEV